MRKLQRDDLANELIDLFVKEKSDQPELFDVSSLQIFPDNEVDGLLKTKFDEVFKTIIKPQSIEDILVNYYHHSSYNECDLNFLKSYDVNQYYQLFKNNHDDKLRKLIKASLALVQDKASEALTIISNESILNKLRVSQYIHVK